MQKALVLALALSALVFTSERAWSCQCSPPSAENARADAEFIFEGFVESEGVSSRSAVSTVTFRDVIVYRGPQVNILTLENGFECAAQELRPGTRMLVYLRGLPGKPETVIDVCQRVVEVGGAGPELAVLRGATDSGPSAAASPASGESTSDVTPAPSPASTPPVEVRGGGGCAGCAIVGTDAEQPGRGAMPLGALAALFGTALFRPRRSPDRRRRA